MTDQPAPIVQTVRHEVSIFPVGDINRRAFTLYVERLRFRRPGEDEWRVTDGQYGYDDQALPGTDVIGAPGFTEETALCIAGEAARHIVVNGMSATEVYHRTHTPGRAGAGRRTTRGRAPTHHTTHLKEIHMSYPQLLSPEEMLTTAKERLQIPTIVCICGSTRFMDEMAEADLRETAAGRIVVKPGVNMKTEHPLWADPLEAERLKGSLDQLHRAKIRLASEVLVVGDYIGTSTTAEIRYARALGIPVRFTHPEVDPAVTR